MVCVQLGYKNPGCEVKVQQSWLSIRTMNYSAISHKLVVIAFCLLFLLDIAEARPWWNSNAVGYDASLDPVAWSRSFVQDHVRKTRYDVVPRRKNRQRQTFAKLWQQKPVEPSDKYFKRFSRRRERLAAREKFPAGGVPPRC